MRTLFGVRTSLFILLAITFILGGSGAVFINYSFNKYESTGKQERTARLLSSHTNHALSNFRKSRLLANQFMIFTRHQQHFNNAKVKYIPEYIDMVDSVYNELSTAQEQALEIDNRYNVFDFIFDNLNLYRNSFDGIVNLTKKSVNHIEHVRRSYLKLTDTLEPIEEKRQRFDLRIARLKVRLDGLTQGHAESESESESEINVLLIIDQLENKISSLKLSHRSRDTIIFNIKEYRVAIIAYYKANNSRIMAMERFNEISHNIDISLEKLDYDTTTFADNLSTTLPHTLKWIPTGVIGAMASIITLVGLIVWLIAFRFSQGINHLFDGINLISKGQLNQPISLGYVSELDKLAKTINSMSKDLSTSNQSLTSSKNYIESIFSSMVESLIVVNEDATIVTVNISARLMLGYSENEMIGKSVRDILIINEKNPKDSAPFILENTLSCEGRYRCKTGELLPVLYSCAKMKTQNGHSSFVYLAQDITERKAMEMSLLQSAKLASLGEISAGLAHEINSPILEISMIAERVKRRYAKGITENLAQVMDQITISVKHVSSLIESLRRVSRQSDHDEFEFTSIHDIINDVISLGSERYSLGGVSIDVQYEGSARGVEVECQRLQISQILINIINNAFSAAQENCEKWIKISVKESNGCIQVSITDSGLGINVNIQKKMFDPMFTSKAIGEGTGLGLSISSTIAKNHNGTLLYEPSTPNTCFILTLPKKHIQSL